MKIWGIGPVIAGCGIAGITAALMLGMKYDLRFALTRSSALIAGSVLMLIGFILWLSSARLMTKHFYAGELITHGAFSIVRNPLYAGIIVNRH